MPHECPVHQSKMSWSASTVWISNIFSGCITKDATTGASLVREAVFVFRCDGFRAAGKIAFSRHLQRKLNLIKLDELKYFLSLSLSSGSILAFRIMWRELQLSCHWGSINYQKQDGSPVFLLSKWKSPESQAIGDLLYAPCKLSWVELCIQLYLYLSLWIGATLKVI